MTPGDVRLGLLEEFSRDELIQRVLVLEKENAYLARQATELAVRLGTYEIQREQQRKRKFLP